MELSRSDRQACDDLGWWFGGIGSTIGLRAGALEGGGGSTYDDAASHRDHMRRRTHEHRVQMARLAIVESALRACDHATVQTLARAFTPFGAARASYRLLSAMSSGGVCLVGVALHSAALVRLWPGEPDPPPAALLMMLEDEVAHLTRGNRIPVSHRLHRVLREAEETTHAALGVYIGQRAIVTRARADERAARVEAMRRRMGAA